MDDAMLIKAALIILCAIVCFWCTETVPSIHKKECLMYDLKNGNVQYRGGNRLAKHYCNRGYTLIGSRHSTCVRGQWNKPIPVCASRTGCETLHSPPQGFISPNYNHAIMYYKCDPGYSLIGSSPIYCDGENWNGTSPACVPAIQNPRHSCDFEESSLCDWSQDTRDDFDWRRNQFSTPSGHGTGPSHDHTHGLGAAGHYMYIEASAPRRINDTARLFSPVFQPDLAYSCFVFWYHMFGSTIGSLRIYIKKDDENLNAIQPLWQKDGEQGPNWLKGTIPIPTLHRNFQVIIEGVRGTSYFSDIAIDDVNLQFESCNGASVNTESSSVTTILSSRPTDYVTMTTTSTKSSVSAVVIESTTLSTATQPIAYHTTKSIDIFTSTHVSLTDTPISSRSVADVITPSQLRSITTQTSSIASTTAEWQGKETSISVSGTRYRWRTKKPKAPLPQVSKAPSKGVLAGVIVVGIFVLLTAFAVFIYFKRFRYRKDNLPEDSDMRYLSGSEEIEYVDNYHSSSSLDELTVT